MVRRLLISMLAVIAVVAICVLAGIVETGPGIHAAPAATTSATGCISYWFVSYSGTVSYSLINIDPDGLPLGDLRFGRTYNDPTDLSHGYLDFNRDGKSDVFSAVPLGDGTYRWRYSSGGTSAWINLAYDSTPPDQLRFGDFNGDGYTDVFALKPDSLVPGYLDWLVSYGGTTNYQQINSATTPLDQLRFGDFNGDGRTDVFALKPDSGAPGYLDWMVSYSGTTNYQQIMSATTPLSEMQFGDVNGDGHTDVFTTVPDANPGLYDWKYSSAGSGAYQSIVINNLSVHDVSLVGDFNGDQRTDWFFTTLRQDGLFQWWYFYYKTIPFAVGSQQLAYDGTPPGQLRFADFNGDGVTDVFKLVRQCKQYLPLVRR